VQYVRNNHLRLTMKCVRPKVVCLVTFELHFKTCVNIGYFCYIDYSLLMFLCNFYEGFGFPGGMGWTGFTGPFGFTGQTGWSSICSGLHLTSFKNCGY